MLSSGVFSGRPYSCWCLACSQVRGLGQGMVSAGKKLNVPGYSRAHLAVWEEFNVASTERAGARALVYGGRGAPPPWASLGLRAWRCWWRQGLLREDFKAGTSYMGDVQGYTL
mmetsp:Transcript_31766/g.68267  ORF Transcript_31766/g.68267 Transcript_31766/m.68267 type:complete len:113 (-) Transcript_31766:354-692(-)